MSQVICMCSSLRCSVTQEIRSSPAVYSTVTPPDAAVSVAQAQAAQPETAAV